MKCEDIAAENTGELGQICLSQNTRCNWKNQKCTTKPKFQNMVTETIANEKRIKDEVIARLTEERHAMGLTGYHGHGREIDYLMRLYDALKATINPADPDPRCTIYYDKGEYKWKIARSSNHQYKYFAAVEGLGVNETPPETFPKGQSPSPPP